MHISNKSANVHLLNQPHCNFNNQRKRNRNKNLFRNIIIQTYSKNVCNNLNSENLWRTSVSGNQHSNFNAASWLPVNFI